MDVSVLVPYRGDDGGPRDRAWEYVQRWLRDRFPDWQVRQGACPPGPWIKAHAVLDALTRSDGDILAIVDADVVSAGVGLAVEAVRSGVAPWATPHRRVYRLTEQATERVLAGGPLPAIPERAPRRRRPGERQRPWRAPDFAEIHTAMPGGGIVVLPRALYEQAPMDPRMRGWGSEDAAAGIMWRTLAGAPFRGTAPLWHMHHPPQPRLSRAVGSQENRALLMRYRDAAKVGPEAMRALLAEMHATPGT